MGERAQMPVHRCQLTASRTGGRVTRMKVPMSAWRLAAGVALLGGIWALAGCETDDAANGTVTVTPASATVGKGGSVPLAASGWYGYTWSLLDSGIGRLSKSTGETTVYTALSAGPATQIVVVTAGSTGTSSTGTVDTVHPTGQAVIFHL
jgi:hypothetical protein